MSWFGAPSPSRLCRRLLHIKYRQQVIELLANHAHLPLAFAKQGSNWAHRVASVQEPDQFSVS